MKNLAVFTMGLPGSGKSTVANRLFDLDAMDVIDPDAIKADHPDYDPKNPSALHAWSNEQAELIYSASLSAGVLDVFVDGTGTNAEKMIRRMGQAREAGYKVILLYVRVSLETAIQRNADRERVVPEYIIREKALDIAVSFSLATAYADSTTVVDND